MSLIDYDLEVLIVTWLKTALTDDVVRTWLDDIADVESTMLFPALGFTITGDEDEGDSKRLFFATIRIFVVGDRKEAKMKAIELKESIRSALKSPPPVKVPRGWGGLRGFSSSNFRAYPDGSSPLFVYDLSFKIMI